MDRSRVKGGCRSAGSRHPPEIAKVVAFLISDDSSDLTGTEVCVEEVRHWAFG